MKRSRHRAYGCGSASITFFSSTYSRIADRREPIKHGRAQFCHSLATAAGGVCNRGDYRSWRLQKLSGLHYYGQQSAEASPCHQHSHVRGRRRAASTEAYWLADKGIEDKLLRPTISSLNPHLTFAVAGSGCTVQKGPQGSIHHCGRSPDMFARHKGDKLSPESLDEWCPPCQAVFLSSDLLSYLFLPASLFSRSLYLWA